MPLRFSKRERKVSYLTYLTQQGELLSWDHNQTKSCEWVDFPFPKYIMHTYPFYSYLLPPPSFIFISIMLITEYTIIFTLKSILWSARVLSGSGSIMAFLFWLGQRVGSSRDGSASAWHIQFTSDRPNFSTGLPAMVSVVSDIIPMGLNIGCYVLLGWENVCRPKWPFSQVELR